LKTTDKQGGRWSFWLDRGGTFTDVVGCSPSGDLVVRKVLSVQPGCPGDPAVAAIQSILGIPAGQPMPEGLVDGVRLGTTVATNALIEHRGQPVLLLINRGLADLPTIGDQHRPDIFALRVERPQPLAIRTLEVDGRLAASGEEVEPLQLGASLATQIRQAMVDGYRSCAIALLHSTSNPRHEQQLAAWVRQLGLEQVVLSCELSCQPRLVSRCQTTLVEAAVAPVLFGYLDQVRQALGLATDLRVMRSSGALAAPGMLHAKDTILSGPAGGMVGAVASARDALAAMGQADGPVVGVDMGGTSTDVFYAESTAQGAAWERLADTEILGLRIQAPMLPIHTVAAGGGSVVSFDGERLLVGPVSAGADPGPACYGRGGPATITDAHVVLGRLPSSALPAVFGPGGDQPINPEASWAVFSALAAAMAGMAPGISPEQVAEGALAIAVETMAQAVRRITIQRGHDLRQALLVSYGGAAGQLACRLAHSLGIGQVVLHPLAGVLSAYGIGVAPQAVLLEHLVRRPLELDLVQQLVSELEHLSAAGTQSMEASGDLEPGQRPQRLVRLELRLSGSEVGLELPWPEDQIQTPAHGLLATWRDGFSASHGRRYGYHPPTPVLVVERLRVELVSPLERQPLAWDGVLRATPAPLDLGQELQGPALLVDATTTTVLEAGWRARGLPGGAIVLQELETAVRGELLGGAGSPRAMATVSDRADPVLLELYNHRFAAIAEQMGERLQQSARSVNIRERLDFSCAIFDAAGQLVANAPHIPVHLGSMGESVVALLTAVACGERSPLAPGDVVLTNNPFKGGTHLPDITAITPVFADGQQGPELVFFVACRGHHGDVGGITPGSMPALSRTIDDEGLLLDNVLFLHAGQLDGEAWQQRLAAGVWPVRNPEQLLADLQAQVAANCYGVEAMQQLVAREGLRQVQAYMAHGQANAAECVRRVIGRLSNGRHQVELDDGAVIAVAIAIDRTSRRARLDFSGTTAQQPSNQNAPLAVTKAVVLYVFRCLVGEKIPLNAGCFEPLDLIVPEGCLLNPLAPAAVVAGNVEVSQAAANALFGALGVQAAAQGTMNNLSFGNASCQYYETICGGTGAGLDLAGHGFAGASAVQSHMTNSRLTDPEVLEARYPVRVEILEPMQAVLLTGSRRVPPFGLAGGEAGRCGRNLLLKPHQSEELLPGVAQVEIQAGEALRLETPGGGGYGAPGEA
jgi:5-oxoprolinase (ATP-hydrolysing)